MRTFLPISIFLFLFIITSCGDSTQTTHNRQDEVPASANKDAVAEERTGTIMFFGTSLTAGYGLEQEEAYPALIQQKLDSLELPFEVVNAGLSGETTSGGKNRIDWVLNQEVDIFVLELGANDGLRGVPLQETRRNLQEIINTVKETYPEAEIILAGMQIPPNMGEAYATGFRNIFPELAQENDLHLIPFLLEDVGGVPALNQRDRIHPTARGQEILARNVWEVLEPVVRKNI